MHKIENTTILVGQLPLTVTNTVFIDCEFVPQNLPNFHGCEFHNCYIASCKFVDLVQCKLFATTISRSDFSEADVSFSITNAGSPCQAYNCEWQGVRAILDCGFWQGLKCHPEDSGLFLIMALLPESTLKKDLYPKLPDEIRQQARKRLQKDFRKKV